ncbi:MAG: hypothetical protein RL645_965 [Actinomycetota bacterium]|jgi:Flp pilus assembly protein CpaB
MEINERQDMNKVGKYALLALGLGSLALGAWQLVDRPETSSATVRVLTAAVDMPAGSLVDSKQLAWVELPQSLAGAYLKSAPAAGAIMLQTVTLGELLPSRAVGSGSGNNLVTGANVVSIRPVVVPVRALRVGDVVDVWTTPSALIASQATVLAVSADEQGYSAATKTIDLAVQADQVQALLAAQLADQSRLAVVRSPLASESDG